MKRSIHLAQQDIYFDQILDLEDPRYNCGICVFFKIRGASMDYDVLQTVIKKFYRQHDAFNLEFDFTDPKNPKCSFDGNLRKNDSREPLLTVHDYTRRKEAHEKALSLTDEIFAKPIDLFGKYLAFMYLVKISKNSFYFILRWHHIIADAYSTIPIMSSLCDIYISTKCPAKDLSPDKAKALLSENSRSYFKEIQRSGKYEMSKQFLIDQQFWSDTFKDLPDPLFAKNEPHKRGFSTVRRDLEDDVRAEFLDISKKTGYSLQKILTAALITILCRLYRKERIVIGILRHNRTEKSQKKIVGMFSGIVPFIGQYQSDMSVSDLLNEVDTLQKQTYKYRKYPLSRIRRDVRSAVSSNRSLIDLIVNYLPFNLIETDSKVIDSYVHRLSGGEGSLPLEVVLSDYGSKMPMVLKIDYLNSYFKKEEVEQLLERVIFVVKQIPTALDKRLSDIKLLFPEEEGELLETFNNTQVAYPREKTVVDLFSEQVLRTPDNVAVVYEDETLTYRELDEKSNQLAHYLLSGGVEKEDLVAICIERGITMIVGILGIVKSGGAYVPIDPAYPRERTAYMLEDTGAAFVLSTSGLRDVVGGYEGVAPIYLDEAWEVLEDYPLSLPDPGLSPDNLAYVIYTSGSTGKPKGVLTEHRNVVRLFFNDAPLFDFNESDVWTMFHSYSFDFAVWEMYGALLQGGELVVVPKEYTKDSVLFCELIEKQGVTVLNQTPFAFNALQEEILARKSPTTIRYVIFGGEALYPSMLEKWKDTYKECRLINMYGITETTVHVTFKAITAKEIALNISDIGMPIPTLGCVLLDEDLRLQPRGVVGELCIGGAGLARGYLNHPELTAQKFVDNPFRPAERLYRTGDLARWLPDGNLEFIGRKDYQVKVRGYRIELGEIESQLQDVPWIKQSVVLARQDHTGAKYLVGYVVLEAEQELDRAALQAYLEAKLPDYMIPRFYIGLPQFPLTPNGKIDRKALPEPDSSALQHQAYVAPRTELERELVSIWQEVLGVDKIGVYDDFFQLGGDSIKGIQLRSRIRKLGYDIKVKDLFEDQTIEKSVKRLRAVRQVQREAGTLSGEALLLPIQQRFFKFPHKEKDHYNQSVLLNISKTVTAKGLQGVIQVLSDQHDALRFGYEPGASGALQRYGSRALELDTEQVSDGEAIMDLCNRYQRSLDIVQGPLTRIVLIETPASEQENRLLIAVHHLGIDGVSWRILLEDLSTLLTRQSQGESLVLEPKQTSYRQWGARLAAYASSRELLVERSYWAGILREAEEIPQDTDYTGLTPFHQTRQHTLILSQKQTHDLLRDTYHAYGTEINDLLLSALALTLTEWLGGDSVVIGLEGHGREDLFDDIDLSKTVGWFTSLYPVALRATPGQSIGYQIIETKESLRGIPNKGIGYSVLRYLSKDETVRASMEATFDSIVFNYLGDFDTSFTPSEGLFSWAAESMGELIGSTNLYEHKLSINCIVLNGALRMTWTYDGNRYEEKTIHTLAARYEHYLSEIIAHCKGVEEPVKTVSDYELPNTITQSELETFKDSDDHPAAIADLYPLSPLQEGLLFHSLYDSSGQAYLVRFTCDFVGGVDSDAFKAVWKRLSQQHSILRTAIYSDQLSIPVQVVYQEVDIPITEIDYRAVAADEIESKLSDYLLEEKHRGMDLSQAPLLRISLVYLPDGRVKFLMTNHHILWDGWSFANLMSELMHLYEYTVKGETLPDMAADNYVDLLRHINEQRIAKGEAYWQEYLSQVEQPSYVPYIKDVSKRNEPLSNTEVRLNIPAELSERLTGYGQSHGLTINTLLQGAWAYLLSRYNNCDTVVFGATVSGRELDVENIEDRIGLYINTLPVVTRVDTDSRIVDWLQELQSGHTVGRTDYSYVPLSRIQSMANIQGHLFDSLMVFENYPVDEALQAADRVLKLADMKIDEGANYVLSLTYLKGDHIVISFGYNEALLDTEAVERIRDHFVQVLENMVSGLDKVGELEYLSDTERIELLESLNNTAVAYPRDRTLVDLFSEQVLRTPHHVAVVYEGASLTYRELDESSNQLAHCLLSKGVKKEELIALCIERSIAMIVGILGIMKSGGAYVPIDPAYPRDRIAYMLEDTRSSVVLSTSGLRHVVEGYDGVTPVYLDEQWEMLGDYPLNLPDSGLSSDHLAYVIYTSGSTGKPKGALTQHNNAVRLFSNDAPLFDFNESDVWTMFHSYSFDFAVWEMYGALLHGGKLVLVPKEYTKDAVLFCDLIEREGITILSQTPSAFSVLQEELLKRQSSLKTVRYIIFAGETLPPSLIKSCRELGIKATLGNIYGPTEATVYSTYYSTSDLTNHHSSVPIGKPINNVQVYILDEDLHLQPRGIAGELCIGGGGLARGYLNRPDLTARKFIDNPFRSGERLYRTGDLARWLPDGNIEFIGRKDYQVKIRGYRIELGEIESQLQDIPWVKQAVVLAREEAGRSKYLVGYVVLEAEQELDREALQVHLKAQLPDYMVPQWYVALPQFPLTSNGKVDRKALPKPDGGALQRQAYVAPRNELERDLVWIWQEVLGVDKIGVHDEFFQLGGDSIKVMRVVAHIRAKSGVDIKVKAVFDAPTLEALAKAISGSEYGGLPAIDKLSERPERVPLSYNQERLWIIDALSGSVHYHIPIAFRLTGDLDIPKLKQSLAALLERHEILRTVYKEKAGVGYQEVLTVADFSLEEAAITGSTAQAQLDSVRDFVSRPFDLSRDYCLRVGILKEAEHSFLLVLVIHHIAADGWSMPIIIREIGALYRAYQQGEQPERLALPVQYADYSLWQRAHLSGEALADKLSYWETHLKGVEPLQIPTDYPRPAVQSQAGSHYKFSIDQALTARLKALARERGATLFMTLLSVYKVLLHRYTDQSDICVGTPIANREQLEIASLVGFFVNTLALHTTIRGTDSFEEALTQVKAVTLSAYSHQDAPFERVVEQVVRNRDQSRSPLFQTMFVLQNNEETEELDLGNIDVERVTTPQETSKFDLTLSASEISGGLSFDIEYCTDLFREDTIKRLSGHFKHIIEAVLEDDKQPIGILNYLSDTERIELLETFNNTQVGYPRDKTLVDLFSAQASRTPGHVAVVYEGEALTYRELEEKSNQLAYYLLSKGVKKEELVALCVARSMAMIVGILGIMKSGGAYVPIDPTYPRERIAYMLADTGSRMVLSTSALQDVVAGYGGVTPIYLDEAWAMLGNYPSSTPDSGLSPDNLAYIIYTSGSTGKPKGTLTQHKNVVRLFSNDAPLFDFNESDVWTMFHSYSFDFAVWEMYGALLQGGKLVLVPKEYTKDSVLFCDLIEREGITVLSQTPSAFSVLQEELLKRQSPLKTVRYIIFAGETLPLSLIKSCSALGIKATLGNIYGPTEATVYSTYYSASDLTNQHSSIPIGKPINNVQVYILDEDLHLQPRGIAGELCIGGAGLARGYLNRSDLTAEKFIDDPFQAGGRLYRSGDLARWLPDGNIEFIGRKDYQVKVRGYRIELGEIESQLQDIPWIKQAVVLAREDADRGKYLVGYIVMEDGQELDRAALQAHLKAQLPDYMVPRLYVGLSQFPLTHNGKVDRKALPEPDGSALQHQAYVAPRNELERDLVSIWEGVLGIDKIGVYDDFFELGGDSLKAMRMVAHIRSERNVEIKVRAVFDALTLEALAKTISGSAYSRLPAIDKLSERPEKLPLSYSQERLWIIDTLSGSANYHIPIAFRLTGDLDVPKLKRSLAALLERHEILRTAYREEAGVGYQEVLAVAGFSVEEAAITGSTAQGQLDGIRDFVSRPFDLSRDYCLRAAILKEAENSFLLVLVIHHIAADGWSMPILVKEIGLLYRAYQRGKEPECLALPIQYADYSLWQRKHLSGAVLEEQLSYWERHLKGVEPLQIPTDYARPSVQSQAGARYEFSIDQALTAALKALSRERGVTLFMTLLSVYKVLLYRYTGQSDLCVGTPIANREQLEIASLVGFFVNTLALRTTIGGTDSFEAVLTQVKAVTLSAYGHQDAPFERVVERVVHNRDQRRSPLFQTMFVLQNDEETQELDLGNIGVEPLAIPYETSKFDLMVSARTLPGGLAIGIEYCTDLFREDTIKRLSQHFKHIIEAVVENDKQPIGALNYLSDAERIELLETFNNTQVSYPRDKTLVDLFSEQVSKTPEHIAVVCGDETLTYRELNEKSNQLAHDLLSKGVKKEELIALCIERSIAMIVGILGIMKSGGAYVPIDPTYPRDRIAYMLGDTASRMVLSTSALRDVVEGYQGVTPIYLDKAWEMLGDYPLSPPDSGLSPDSLAYIIYTSGSTGKPKGVLTAHKNVVRLFSNDAPLFDFNESDVWTMFHSYSFDFAVWEMYGALLQGGKLVLVPEEYTKDSVLFCELIEREGITILSQTPSSFSVLQEELLKRQSALAKLRYVIFAGETLPPSLIKSCRELGIKATLGNIYGPTEATVYSTYYSASDLTHQHSSVPIGKPINNVQVYILDEDLHLQPRGIVGELCISGAGLARGYLNRPDLTAQKFVDNPFQAGGHLYRSGDLARWLPDGNIEFIGRKDYQVKVRGYRIELGEIESQLQELPWIKQAVVLTKQDAGGSKYLVGYVVLEPEQELDRAAIQGHLKAQLPDYMIPRLYVGLPELPLTPNGKIDRKALPQPDGSALEHQVYLAPRNELERELVSIWQGVLGVEKIGVYDDFFELGGDSIKAIQLRSRIRKLGYDIKVRDLFENQTIDESVKRLRAVRQVQSEAGALSGEALLLPIQQRFFETAHKEKDQYNQCALLNISKAIKAEDLQAVIQLLSQRHDALRFEYELGASGVCQRYGSQALVLETEQVSGGEAIEDLCNRYQRSLDIEEGPLTRIVLIETPASQQANRLFITVHHLGVDGVSWRIVLEDLAALLTRQSQGESLVLEPKQTSYRQWGERLAAYACSQELSLEHAYWTEVLGKAEKIPQDTHYTGLTPFDQARHHTLVLSQKQTRDLLRDTHQAYGTEINDLLLAALALTLAEWLGGDSLVIGLEGHGREDLFDDIDLSKTVGWFTSLYPVALRATPGQSIAQQIIETKESLRGIPNKGIGYGLLRYLSKDETLRASMEVAFDSIVFNYLGDLDTSFTPSEGLFSRAAESTGDSIGVSNAFEHKLSINCIVLNQALHMSWIYDANRYQEKTIHTLATRYEHYLSEIITHCKGVEEPVKTASDYGLPNTITQSELEAFKNSDDHPAAIADLYPLSPLQEGLLFHSLYDVSGQAYLVRFSCDFIGGVDSTAFRAVWKYLSQQHSIFRTAIYCEALSIPVQVVYQGVDIPITEIDYRAVAADEIESKLSNYLLEEKHRGMDLSQVPLLRISLVYLPDGRVKFLMTNHHILWDGWSFANLMSELMHLYACIVKDEALPALKADNYIDLLHYINKRNITKGEAYWQGYLSEIEQPSYVPYIKDADKRNGLEGNTELRLDMPAELREQLTQYSQSNGLTVNTLLQGAWAYLLSRYNNQDTVVFGATVSGRELDIENIENRIGLYINTLPVVTRVDTDSRIAEWLQALQSGHTVGRTDYNYVPLNRIQSTTNIQGHLFDSLMVFENYPADEALQAMGEVLEVADIDVEEGTNYVLSLICYLRGAHMGVHFGYHEALLDKEAVERIRDHLVQLLKSMVSGVDRINELEYLSDPERTELLETFNDTAVAYPTDKTLVDLFSAQASRTPNHVAVVYEAESLTYRELDEKSNQLAHYLLSKGVEKEDLVAVCIARSIAMIVGILGIVKSGGAYVPIDPGYPKERIAHMLADTGCGVVLSASGLRDLVEGHAAAVPIYLDEAREVLGDYPPSAPDIGLSPDKLAYVIYTSGSTGRPKGVMMEHRSLVNLLLWQEAHFKYKSKRKVLQFASISFDVSFQEIFSTICLGGSLYLLSEQTRERLEEVSSYIAEQKVTHLFLPFVALETLCELLSGEGELFIKEIVTAGEQLELSSGIRKFIEDQNCRLINQYGPTESHVVAEFDVAGCDEFLPPIGQPTANTQLYILDDCHKLQPKGIVGELCIGGAQLARGYLNRADLTAEKFVDNPFQPGMRMYCTGDLARWLPDGNIALLGRKDQQVKIRGYRIELGEIESQLQAIPWVKQSVVLARQDAGRSKYLVGYVVLEDEQALDRTAIQDYLKTQLPDYMVPQWYVSLAALPLTPNGKLDRSALPEPDESALQRQAYVGPRTERERELVSIWQTVLGVDKIGVRDDFFELGGDSIKAIQLRSRIRKLGYDIKVKDLFDCQTIEKCVKCLRAVRQVQREAGVLSGEVILLPIQQRFFDAPHRQKDQYNQAGLIAIGKEVKVEALRAVIQVLSEQHDGLRFQYEIDGSGVRQLYGSKALELDIERVSSTEDIGDLCDRYQSSLDMAQGPITRIVWIETPASECANRLFITVHHLGVDGVSWRILLEDLHTLLKQQSQGESLVLEPKQTSFRQWGARLVAYAASEELLAERSYWAGILSKAEEIPQDKDYTGLTLFHQVGRHTAVLSQEQTCDLLRGTHRAYGTEINDLLLTALALTLLEWSGGDSLVIGVEGHGREDLFDDIDVSKTIGWFTSLYPVALRATPGQSIGEQIIQTKENLRGLPNKGIGYSVLRYLSKDETVRASMQAPFDSIVFNYLGELDTSFTPSEGPFSRALESMGNSVGPNNIYEYKMLINSEVLNGELNMNWSYDSNRYDEKTIHTLAARYEHYLSKIIARCKGVKEPVKTVSDYGLPAAITQSELETFKNGDSHPAAIVDLYPLSPLQEGLLFHSLYDTSGQAYLVHFSCDFVGGVAGDAFKAAWKYLSQQHSILRTAIYPEALSIPVQVVYQEVDIPITEIDYRDVAADEIESKWSDYLLEEKHRGMDLTQAPLLRISLVYLPDGRVRFLTTNHHILWDGWSFANLIGELIRLYENITKGEALPALIADNYADLLRHINKQDSKKGEAYWQEYLSELEQPSYVPYIKDVSKRNELASNTAVRLDVSPELSERLTGYSQSNGLTVNTVLQGAWAYLLSRYNNCDTVAFGATVSGRELEIEDVENRVGLYINTLPVATHIDPGSRIVDWLQTLQSGHTIGRTDYSYVSLSRIQSMANIQGHLFDSLMVFENYPVDEALQATDRVLQVADVNTDDGTNYVLSLTYLKGDHIVISFEYHKALLDTEAVERIRDHFLELLKSMVSGVDKISELEYLSEAEHTELLETFNDTAVAYPSDKKTVVELFSAQASRTPDHLAVVCEGASLTYRELDEKSNQLAHYLLSRGVKKEELVAICMERGIAMIVGVLGIIKSGGAYVPIDAAYPRERIAYVLADTGSSIVLSTSVLQDVIQGHDGVAPTYLDKAWEMLGNYPSSLPDVGLSPDNLAYVIYTSGSTGKPKGVMIEQSSLVNLILWYQEAYELNASSRGILYASIGFDVSVSEIFPYLTIGSTLYPIVEDEIRMDIKRLEKFLKDNKITHCELPSQLCHELIDQGIALEDVTMLTGGDVFKMPKPTSLNIHNTYGPTENTINTTWFDVGDNYRSNVPIGKPINNVQVYILGEDLQLQPRGIAGELCTGGVQLARGYLNRPDLTAEKFVDNPFRPGERIYRTGDLARWLPDGNIEFLGRKDHQVKIRGYRIELGEIESQLQAIPWIKQAVVLASEDAGGNKYLVGYVVLEPEQELDRAALQAHLKAQLPDYMVPRLYVGLSEFPLTSSGKVERKALPEPDESALQRQVYVGPRNELERDLVSIWQGVLGVDKIGVHDDFFELGGNSIKAMRVVSQIRAKIDIEIKMRALFNCATVEELARLINISKRDYVTIEEDIDEKDFI